MSTKKRIEWIDTLKFACMAMVILSHLESQTELWEAFYQPFFLNGFLFASGYVYRHQKGLLALVRKRFKQLFIPWLIFSNFIVISAHIISFNAHQSLLSELIWNALQIRSLGDELWFVAMLFVAAIPFYFFVEIYRKSTSRAGSMLCVAVAALLSLASVVYSALMPSDIFPWHSNALPWHMEYIFQALFFMALGYLFREKFEPYFDSRNTAKARVLLLSIYLLLVYIPRLTDWEMPLPVSIAYTYLCQLIGVATAVSIVKAVHASSFILFVGQNTIAYFGLHGKVFSLLQTVIKKLFGTLYVQILNNELASSVFAFALTLTICALLIVPIKLINRFFPFAVGKSKDAK